MLARALTTVLSSLVLVVATAAPAGAATNTWAYHDGTADTFVTVDGTYDKAELKFPGYDGMTSATSATLRVYGRAGTCAGGTHQIYAVMRGPVASFDPCATFPAGSFGWASFPVPMSLLDDTGVKFVLSHQTGTAAADYALDTAPKHPFTYPYAWTPESGYVAGTPMWELVFDGSTPAVATTPNAVKYGMPALGAPVARTVTVTSSGTGTANVTPSVSGHADFAVTADSCTGVALPPQATCTVEVTFTPAAIGDRAATLTVSGNVTSRTVALTGAGRSAPTTTTITTPANGATLLPGGSVAGTITDDLGVAEMWVRYDPTAPGLATVTQRPVLTCGSGALSCTWSHAPLLTPGEYVVTAWGVDVQRIVESPGASVTFLAV